jgi:hypothetical protein
LLQIAKGRQILDEAVDSRARFTETLGEVRRAQVGLDGQNVEEPRGLTEDFYARGGHFRLF